jgi:hypothetical protein
MDTTPSGKDYTVKTPQPTTATPIPIQSPPYSPPPSKNWEREYRILRQAYLKQEKRLNVLHEEHLQLQTEMLALKESSTCPREQETNNSTRPNHYSTNKTLNYSSPGTRFVAELSEVMELDVGQHALLSSIIDRDTKKKYTSY